MSLPKTIYYCEAHKLSELSGGRCATAWLPNGARTPCRMVEYELHPVGTHAEIARTRAFFDPDGEVDDVEVV